MGAWGSQPCRVLEVDPGKSISYTFAEGALDTIISWTLEPDGTGTRLHLVHSGFDLDSPDGRVSYAGMGRGWPGVVARIAQILEASGPGESQRKTRRSTVRWRGAGIEHRTRPAPAPQ